MQPSPAPVLAWLGEPPPEDLAADLRDLARLHLGWTPEAVLVSALARSGPKVMQGLPPVTQRPPVIAVCEGPPTVAERLAWIRAGADDLLPQGSLRNALLRRIQLEGDAAPVISVEGNPHAETVVPETPVPLQAVRVARGDGGPFPPIVLPMAKPLDPVARYVDAMTRYLDKRNLLVGRLDPGGLAQFLALVHLREQLEVPTASSAPVMDLYGQVRGGGSVSVNWPVAVRSVDDPSPNAEIREATLLTCGRDGCCLSLSFAAYEGQRWMVDIAVSPASNAQFLVESRWQRRVSRHTWHVGAVHLKLRIRAHDGG